MFSDEQIDIHSQEQSEPQASPPATTEATVEASASSTDQTPPPNEDIQGTIKTGSEVEAGGTPGEPAAAESSAGPGKKTRRRSAETVSQPAAEQPAERMAWYIVKVQTNREDTACEALKRRIKVSGLDQYFGQIIVPVERITEVKGGKKRIVRRKLYPGYIVVEMVLNDDTWFLVRETPGIGDFTGAIGRPTPLLAHEVNRILAKLAEEKAEDAPKLKIGCRVGDRVKINEGHFANFEGEVSAVDEANGRVTVMINIFGRSTPVELEYWQVEPAA